MAFNHVNASTYTTAQPLLKISANARPQTPITVYNGHSGTIYVGDATITTSGATIGRTLAAGTSQTFYASANDVIYGVSAAASATGAVVITYSA